MKLLKYQQDIFNDRKKNGSCLLSFLFVRRIHYCITHKLDFHLLSCIWLNAKCNGIIQKGHQWYFTSSFPMTVLGSIEADKRQAGDPLLRSLVSHLTCTHAGYLSTTCHVCSKRLPSLLSNWIPMFFHLEQIPLMPFRADWQAQTHQTQRSGSSEKGRGPQLNCNISVTLKTSKQMFSFDGGGGNG